MTPAHVPRSGHAYADENADKDAPSGPPSTRGSIARSSINKIENTAVEISHSADTVGAALLNPTTLLPSPSQPSSTTPSTEAQAPPSTVPQTSQQIGQLNNNPTPSSPRLVSFNMATTTESRKRNTHTTSWPHERTSTTDTDEHAPIIQHNRDAGRDYMSISPGVGPRKTVGERTTDEATERERQQERRAQEEAAHTERRERSWWRGVVEKYGAVELENKGSVARDHLALERTFLAWLRTSLSFASIGIAITQLFRLNTSISPSDPPSSSPGHPSPQASLRHVGKPLGATFIAISILVLFIGFHRYFESQHYVIRGKFPASRGSILVVTGVAGSLIVASLVVVVAVAPGLFEK